MDKMKWREDISTIKNKKNCLQQFIEFNNYLNDGIVQCVINYYEQFPINDYYIEKFVDDSYFISIPVKDFTIDLYHNKQNTDAIQVDKAELTRATLCNWDTKKDYNLFSNVCTKSLYYNYCGADINSLLILKEHMFNTMQNLFKDKSNILEMPTKSIFIIDIQKLKNYFYAQSRKNLVLYRIKQNLCNGKQKRKKRLRQEETCMLSRNNKENSFDIIIQQQYMGLKISICKYSVPKLLAILSKVGELCGKSTPSSKCVSISSLYVGNWYFRNVSQGYLLRILLWNINVNSINVMRNLYFILITDRNPNLNVQINFSLTHSVLTVFNKLFDQFSFKSVEWNEKHRHVLKSLSGTTFYFTNTWNGNHSLKKPKAITYEKSSNHAIYQGVHQSSQTENRDNILQRVLYIGGSTNTFLLCSADNSKMSYVKCVSVDEIAVQTNTVTVFTWCACDFPFKTTILGLIELQKSMFDIDNMIDETMFEASATSVEGYQKYYKSLFNSGPDLFVNLIKTISNVFLQFLQGSK